MLIDNNLSAEGVAATVTQLAVGSAQADLLTIAVTDFGSDTSPLSPLSPLSSLTLPIYILPVADLPLLEVVGGGGVQVQEDSSAAVSVLLTSLDGAVDRAASFEFNVTSPYATVLLGGAEGVEVRYYCGEVLQTTESSLCPPPTPTPPTRLQLTGSLLSLQTALSYMLYTPLPDFSGPTLLLLSVGRPTGLARRSVALEVAVGPVYDPPAVLLGSSNMVAVAGQAAPLLSVQVSDPDSLYLPPSTSSPPPLTVTLTLTAGDLLVPVLREALPGEFRPTHWTSTLSLPRDNGHAKVVLSGSAGAVNTLLHRMQFMGEESAVLTVTVTSGSGSGLSGVMGAGSGLGAGLGGGSGIGGTATASASVSIRVVSASSQSDLLLSLESASMQEDQQWSPPSPMLAYAKGAAEGVLEILMLCDAGNLEISPAALDTLGARVEVLSTGKILHIRTSSLKAMTLALRGVVFTPPVDFWGGVSVSVSAVADPMGERGEPSITAGSFVILVVAVDDPPIISVSPVGVGWVGGVVTEARKLRLFSVTDVDDSCPMKVVLTCSGGGLALTPTTTTLLYAVPDDDADSIDADATSTSFSTSVSFMAPPSNVTLLLDQILYTPPAHFKGTVTLTLTVSSQALNDDPLAVLSLPPHRERAPTALYRATSVVTSSVTISVDSPSSMQFSCVGGVTSLEDETFRVGGACSLLLSLQDGDVDGGVDGGMGSGGTGSGGMGSGGMGSGGRVTLSAAALEGVLYVTQDADFGEHLYTVLSSTPATPATPATAATATATPAGVSELTVQLSPRHVQLFLSHLTYSGAEDYNGADALTLSASYQDTGAVSTVTAAHTLPLSIVAVNDAPVLTALTRPSELLSSETLALSFLSVSDVDMHETSEAEGGLGGLGGWLDLTLSAHRGTVELLYGMYGMDMGVYIADDGMVTGQVHLVGADAALTLLLHSGAVLYRPLSTTPSLTSSPTSSTSNHTHTLDSIFVSVSDNGFYGVNTDHPDSPQTATLTLPLTVIMETLNVSVTAKTAYGTEDVPLPLSLTLSTGSYLNPTLAVTIHSTGGVFLCLNNATLTQSDLSGGGFEAHSAADGLHLRGTARLVRQALQSLLFLPAADVSLFVPCTVRVLHYLDHYLENTDTENAVAHPLLDPLSGVHSSVSFYVYLAPVNDPPQVRSQPLTVPQSAVVRLDGVTITDVDAEEGPPRAERGFVIVKVTAPCGAVSLKQPSAALVRAALSSPHLNATLTYVGETPLSFESDLCPPVATLSLSPQSQLGTGVLLGYRSVTVSGHLSLVNLLVSSLSYTAPPTAGPTQLLIDVSDRGFGSPPLTCSHSLPLLISPLPRAPHLTVTGLRPAFSGESVFFGRGLIELSAYGAPSDLLTLNLSVDLHLPTYPPAVLSLPQRFAALVVGRYQSGAALRGTVSGLTEAAGEVAVALPELYHGLVSVTYTLADGATSATATAQVRVSPVNHAPTIVLDEALLSTPEDTPSAIPFTVEDPDVTFLMDSGSPIYLRAPHTCHVALTAVCKNCHFRSTSNTSTVTTLEVTDTPAAVNALLAQLTLVGDKDYSGSAYIDVTVADFGLLGTPPLSYAGRVGVHITPVNDPPLVSLPLPLLLTEENLSTSISTAGQVVTPSSLFVVVSDADAAADEKITLSIVCAHCDLQLLPSHAHIEVSLNDSRRAGPGLGGTGGVGAGGGRLLDSLLDSTVSTLHSSSLQISANILNLNLALRGLRLQADPFYSGSDQVRFSVLDGVGATSEVVLEVVVRGVNHPPLISLSGVLGVQGGEDGVVSIQGVTVSDPDGTPLEVLVSASHGGVLEVQQVTTSAVHVDPIQLITTNTTGGNFSLSLDLTAYSLGVAVTPPIHFDAVGMRWAELGTEGGGGVGESLQAKLEDLYALRVLGVTVSVTLRHLELSPDTEESQYRDLSSFADLQSRTGSRQWEVTFHNAAAHFPPLQVRHNHLTLGAEKASVEVQVSNPGNALGGSFQLILGGASTSDIPYDAPEEAMAAALEALPSVRAVAVTRTPSFSTSVYSDSTIGGLERGFNWQVTFFAVNSESGDVPQMRANYSQLTGSLPITLPNGTVDTIREATVGIETLVQGVGRPRVLLLQSRATHFDQVVEVRLSTEGSEGGLEFFHIRATRPHLSQVLVGPIFAHTVAQAVDEIGHPPKAAAGTRRGESVQSQFRDSGLLASLSAPVGPLADVKVSKLSVAVGGTVHTSWRITFLHADHANWEYVTVPSAVDANYSTSPLDVILGLAWVLPTSRLNVTTATPSNAIGGTFGLTYGGESAVLQFDASAAQLQAALEQLYSADPLLGQVAVQRRGPSLEGAYRWYIAFTQDADSHLSPQIPLGASGLTGAGCSISLSLLRGAVGGYGLRLPQAVPGVSNGLSGGGGSLFDWQTSLVLIGSPASITSALNTVQYKPAADWAGEGASAVLTATILPANDPPVLLWRGLPLSLSEVAVFEDADVLLGDEDGVFSQTGVEGVLGGVGVEGVVVGAQGLTDPHRVVTRTGLQVSDVDIDAASLTITLKVSSGSISVQGAAPLRGLSAAYVLEVSRLSVDLHLSRGTVATGGESLVLRGDVISLNQQLASLRYQSPLNANGYDYITVTLSDTEGADGTEGVGEGAGGVLRVRIVPLNDPPVISIQGTEAGTLYSDLATWEVRVIDSVEDEVVPLGTYIAISDPDLDPHNFIGESFGAGLGRIDDLFSEDSFPNTVFASISVEHGTLSLPTSGGISFLDSPQQLDLMLTSGQYPTTHLGKGGGGSGEAHLFGAYVDVQAALGSLLYTPDADWFGVDLFSITLNDLGNLGGGQRTLSRQILLDIGSVEDAPVIILPGTMQTVEDTVGVIGADCCNWTSPSSPSIYNISLTSVQISDRDVKTTLSTRRAVVRSTQSFSNPTTNDPLFNRTYTDPQHQDLRQYIYDSDHTPANNSYTVSLNVSHGTLTIPRAPARVEFLFGAGFLDDSIIMRGPLIEINIALRGLNYQPDLNWNSLQGGQAAYHGVSSVETLHIRVVDAGGLEDAESVSIFVKPANDPPVLSVGLVLHDEVDSVADQLSHTVLTVQTLQCLENEKCPLADLVVRDVDVRETVNGLMLVTLSARNGSFSVDRHSPLARFFNRDTGTGAGTGAGAGAGRVVISVPPTALDTVLKGVAYTPEVDFYGFDSIVVTADDMGNTGYGPLCPGLESLGVPCPLTDTLTIPVYVSPAPDSVEILLPGVATCTEDGAALLSLSFVNHQHIALDSLDASTHDTFAAAQLVNITANKVFHVRLVTSAGTLSLQVAPEGLVFDAGTGGGEQQSEMAFQGPLHLLNAAVAGVRFEPSLHLNMLNAGTSSVSVTITDTTTVGVEGGSIGLPRVATAVADLFVRVLPVDDAPKVHLPGEVFEVGDSLSGRVATVVSVAPVLLLEEQEYTLSELYVTDVDAGEYKYSTMAVTVTCLHGTFSSHNLTAAHFLQPMGLPSTPIYQQSLYGRQQVSAQSRSVRLQGSLGEVNALLAQLTYRPDIHYNGADGVTVSVCAVCLRRSGVVEAVLGFESSSSSSTSSSTSTSTTSTPSPASASPFLDLTRDDCPTCHSQTLPLLLSAVNDAPEWVAPRTPLMVLEDQAYPVGGVSVVDVDSEHLLVRLQVDRGTLTLPFLPLNVTLLEGQGDNDAAVLMRGSLTNLNIALASLLYQPPRNWNSLKTGVPDVLHLTVTDGGGVMAGSPSSPSSEPLTATAEVVLVVTDAQHTPYVLLPGMTTVPHPCNSQDGQLGEYQEIRVTPRQQQCERITGVDVLHVTEDTPTIIHNVTVGDADEAYREFLMADYQLNLSCTHGLLALPDALKYGVRVTVLRGSGGSGSGSG
ncbi:hypothetical protein B484DRAFT_417484, partial [Ochromonadaceae sp. CCMP2298]